MKYEDSKPERIHRLAKIFVDENTIDEYRVKADIAGISRKNYLFMFDPFVLYWIVQQYGHWPRFAIGIGMQILSMIVCLLVFGLTSYVVITSGIIGILSLVLFDIGRIVAKNAIERIKFDKFYEKCKASGLIA